MCTFHVGKLYRYKIAMVNVLHYGENKESNNCLLNYLDMGYSLN